MPKGKKLKKRTSEECSVINVNNFSIHTLTQFYRYSALALKNPSTIKALAKHDQSWMAPAIKPFIIEKPGVKQQKSVEDILAENMALMVEKSIDDGLVILRRQLIEAAFSIFESFLCHVLRVYLHTFPVILMGSKDKTLTFEEIVKMPEEVTALECAIEKEIDAFSFLSIDKKKRYFDKRLHMGKHSDIWQSEIDRQWLSIDVIRQEIVHGEQPPHISEDELYKTVNYFFRVMLMICLISQAHKGVPFRWGVPQMMQDIRIADPKDLTG